MKDYKYQPPSYTYYGLISPVTQKTTIFCDMAKGIEFLAPYVMAKDQNGYWFLKSSQMTVRITSPHFDSFVEEGLWVEMNPKDIPPKML